MATVKESSTFNENKKRSMLECPVSYVLNKLGGHWKPIVIYHLLSGPRRYSYLKKAIPVITEKMLIQTLKELQADNLVIRKAEPVVPPHVTYTLTPSGKALMPILKAMGEWAVKDSKRKPVDMYGLFSETRIRRDRPTRLLRSTGR
jgi:DNA-binding HxlR family transcriptional regulator